MHSPHFLRPRFMYGPLALALLVGAPVPAGSAVRVPVSSLPSTHVVDVSQSIDANLVSMFVTNVGSIAFDLAAGNSGLEFPRGSGKTAVFAAGLWVGGRVGGQTRVTVAEYSQEYVPGPMAGGTFLPDSPTYRVYKVSRGDTTGYADWMANAVPLGAPTDLSGTLPGIIGDQTLWTVFNDADVGMHTNDAGATQPLGVEVQLLAFAFDRPGALGHTVFLRYRLVNKGANTLNDAYVSMWADPDLGGAADDLVGVDVPGRLGYCYNADDLDDMYGAAPPAVGFDLLQGPRGDGGGSLGLASFNKYINGTDPNSYLQSYNYMQGLSPAGAPIVNPVTGQVTTFYHDGNPCTGTGWIDALPSDRRLMLSSGPFTFSPGETEELVYAIVLGQGANNIASIGALKCNDAVAQQLFELGFDESALPPEPACTICNPTTAAQVSLVSARHEGGRVRLEWYAADDDGSSLQLERHEEDSGWMTLGAIRPDGSGRIEYEDADVQAGRSYGYRLGADPGTGVLEYVGETWVDVPGATLAITALRSGDGGARLALRVTLPGGGEARIIVRDVAGRVVARHGLAARGAGMYDVALGAERRFAPGVYLVRVEQGARRADTKAVVTP